MRLTGDWRTVGPMLKALNIVAPQIVHRAVQQEALLYEKEMKERIVKQDIVPPELSPLTLAIRKLNRNSGTKALAVTGALMRSIKTITPVNPTVKGFQVFVGVNRKSRTNLHGGKGWSAKLINVAMAQELGTKKFYIRVTPKLRKFWALLWWMGFVAAPLKASTTVLGPFQTPARPFIGPVQW